MSFPTDYSAKSYKPLTYNYGNKHKANKHSLLGLNMPSNLMQKTFSCRLVNVQSQLEKTLNEKHALGNKIAITIFGSTRFLSLSYIAIRRML